MIRQKIRGLGLWSVVGLFLVSSVISVNTARAAEFLEGFAMSALISTGFDISSDGGNEKRVELALIHDEAAEYIAGSQVSPSASLQEVFANMESEIREQQPEYDLSKPHDRDFAIAILKVSRPAE